jgi:hypothetical protein
MKKYLACAAALLAASLLFAQSEHAPFSKVYIGSDRLAHVVDAAGKDTAFPKEQGQVAVDSPDISPDKQSAGWLIEEDNCCTSYPIPTGLLIYSQGKKRILGTGQMIYDWCFVKGGKEVALSAGPVHNPVGQDVLRFDTESSKLLQEWSGGVEDSRPDWAACIGQP